MSKLPIRGRMNLCLAVKRLEAGSLPASWDGICHLVTGGRNMPYPPLFKTDYVDAMTWLRDAFKAWPEYSGNISYPVPAPKSAKMYYRRSDTRALHAWRTLDHWGEGDYAATRLRLLAFLVARANSERTKAEWED